MEEEYFWLWYDDGGEWSPFSESIMAQLEQARRSLTPSIQVQLGGSTTKYELNLQREIQINVQTKYPRPIKKATALWYWRDDDGVSWNRYNRQDALQLALAEERTSRVVAAAATAGGVERGVYFQRGNNTLYYVDLNQRVQKNMMTMFQRPILKGLPPTSTTTTAAVAVASPTTNNNNRRRSSGSSNNSTRAGDASNKSVNAQQQQQEEEEEEDASSPPKVFRCPLSNQLMVDPVTTREGVTYERSNIEEYLSTHDNDPVTKRVLRDKSLMGNRALRDTIEAWAQFHQSHQQAPTAPTSTSTSTSTSAGNSSSTERKLLPQHHHHQQQQQQIRFTEDYERSDSIQDSLKVVCLGLSNVGTDVAFRNPTQDNLYEWKLHLQQQQQQQQQQQSPSSSNKQQQLEGIHCNVYDFVGQNIHHATQKLFFSPQQQQSIYVVVWDMGLKAPPGDDIALERDMYENVQFWMDAIQKRSNSSSGGAIILPVVSLDGSFGSTSRPSSRSSSYAKTPSSTTTTTTTQQNGSIHQLTEAEILRRCWQLRNYLEECNKEKEPSEQVNLLFGPDDDPILKLGSTSSSTTTTTSTNQQKDDALLPLKQRILRVATTQECPALFDHLGSSVSATYQTVLHTVRGMMKKGDKIVQLDTVASACPAEVSMAEVRAALDWIAGMGDILYYGSDNNDNNSNSVEDQQLSQYVILDTRWVADAIASILRPDAEKAIRKAKKKRNAKHGMPKRDDNQNDNNNNNNSHVSHPGPVITEDDARLLWEEALSKNSTGAGGEDSSGSDAVSKASLGQLFDFLQLLFTRYGVMIPLDATENDDMALAEMSTVFAGKSDNPLVIDIPGDSRLFFLPGLLGPGEHGKSLGLYQNAVFSKTTLAQSVQFYSMISPLLLERICAASLRQLYSASEESRIGKEPVEGQMYVKDVLCWRTLLYFKLGLYIRNSDGELQTSVVDIYAHLVDHTSELCVGSKFMGDAKQCLVISAKGEEGNDGSVIWQGGYDLITEAIRRLIEVSTGIDYDRQVFCPTCLARRDLRDTRSWSECVIQRALEEGEHEVKCQDGHREKTRLLLGLSDKCDDTEKLFPSPSDVPAHDLMRGVVMVGLYDENQTSNKIRKLGSGFVVDSERGLIVTAGHTLMKIWGKEDFGTDYDGIEGAKVVIGIIPAKKKTDAFYPPAVFRYFATILEKDPSLSDGECHVDACVLQITSRFENDVDGNGDACSQEISMRLHGNPLLLKEQELMSLDITTESHLGEPTRILGFDQPDTSRLNRSFGVSAGYVCKQFETTTVGGERYRYMPRKKTVLMCPTIGGHSGGPCVNQDGQVIGILSCADPTEKSRCYLVPTSEWVHLLPKKSLVSATSKDKSSILKRAVSLVKRPSNKSA